MARRIVRTYSELNSIPTYSERLAYLRLDGSVGKETFGFDRIFNQQFYRSPDWKRIRNFVIARDAGFDMGCKDIPIAGKVLVHHMNPIDINDIKDGTEFLLNPEYLVSVSIDTHNAIHYGTDIPKVIEPTVREPNDTCPWKGK